MKQQRYKFNQLAIGKETSCFLGMGINILYSSCSLLGQAHKDESLVTLSPIGEFIKKANGFVGIFPCSKGFILGFWTKCNACYIFFMFVGVSFMLPHVMYFVPWLFGLKKNRDVDFHYSPMDVNDTKLVSLLWWKVVLSTYNIPSY